MEDSFFSSKVGERAKFSICKIGSNQDQNKLEFFFHSKKCIMHPLSI